MNFSSSLTISTRAWAFRSASWLMHRCLDHTFSHRALTAGLPYQTKSNQTTIICRPRTWCLPENVVFDVMLTRDVSAPCLQDLSENALQGRYLHKIVQRSPCLSGGSLSSSECRKSRDVCSGTASAAVSGVALAPRHSVHGTLARKYKSPPRPAVLTRRSVDFPSRTPTTTIPSFRLCSHAQHVRSPRSRRLCSRRPSVCCTCGSRRVLLVFVPRHECARR
jgi:hypothetical protein